MSGPVPFRTRRWWRSGRFWAIAAGALAGLCMATLLVWSANDASFRPALLQWEVSLGLKQMLLAGPKLGGDLGLNDRSRSLHWDGLGKREIALHVLVSVGSLATALFAVMAFRPPRAWRVVALIGVIVGWALLYATQSLVDDWRARRQVAAIFPRIEEAGLALSRKWPTESGRIPPDIDIWVDAKKNPDKLILLGRPEPYPFQEAIGYKITRGTNGIISFSLHAHYQMTVEYHPHNTLPGVNSVGRDNPTPPVTRSDQIKDNWYLVRYGG